MGQSQSAQNRLREMSAEDVAGIVKGMGAAYEKYVDNFVSNGIDGMMISQTEESEISSFLTELGVTSILH